jgi:hypothetical protein
MIWVKAKEGEAFAKLVLPVTDSNKNIKYQDHVILIDVNDTPIQTALPSVPFRHLEFEGYAVRTPYDTIQTRVLEAYDQAGRKIDLYFNYKKSLRPVDRLAVALGWEKGDVEKWGEIFNLEFIEMEVKEEKIKLIGYRLGKGSIIYRLRTRLFTIDRLVRVIFWSKNIITAKHLRKQFIKYLKKQEELEKWRGEKAK